MSTHRTFLTTAAVCASLLATAASASGAPPDVCLSGCPYSSIQTAINATAAGGTVTVGPGTFAESILIPAGKDGLTLQGAQAGARPDQSPAPQDEQSVVTAPNYGHAFTVRSNDVTFDGLTISDSGLGVFTDAATSGLQVVSSSFQRNG